MKQTIYDRIKERRIELGLTQEELAERMGYKSRSTINKIEKGMVDVARNKIAKFATVLGVTPAYLMGWDTEDTPAPTEGTSINFQPKGVQIPVLGCVIAGVPIEAVEDILGYEEISSSLAATGEFFCLKIKGDSMEPTFTEGDIIVIRQQPDVETNEIAVVLVNGDEGTVKRIKKEDHGIFLIGDNAMAFSPRFYSDKEIRELPVKIIGKVIELRRTF